MRDLCEAIKESVDEVLERWEGLVREEPWFSLPRAHRLNNLTSVVVSLVDAALCDPTEVEKHRECVVQATLHGRSRRDQGVPESLLFTEFHLLRQALWYHLVDRFGASDRTVSAIMRIDRAITTVTNASMWGYYRDEVEAMGKWEASVDRLANSSTLLAERTVGGVRN